MAVRWQCRSVRTLLQCYLLQCWFSCLNVQTDLARLWGRMWRFLQTAARGEPAWGQCCVMTEGIHRILFLFFWSRGKVDAVCLTSSPGSLWVLRCVRKGYTILVKSLDTVTVCSIHRGYKSVLSSRSIRKTCQSLELWGRNPVEAKNTWYFTVRFTEAKEKLCEQIVVKVYLIMPFV